MARTELYDDSCDALLKSRRAAEFRMAWNMTYQWRNQQLRRCHVARENQYRSLSPEIGVGRMKEEERGGKMERKSERKKSRRKEKQVREGNEWSNKKREGKEDGVRSYVKLSFLWPVGVSYRSIVIKITEREKIPRRSTLPDIGGLSLLVTPLQRIDEEDGGMMSWINRENGDIWSPDSRRKSHLSEASIVRSPLNFPPRFDWIRSIRTLPAGSGTITAHEYS